MVDANLIYNFVCDPKSGRHSSSIHIEDNTLKHSMGLNSMDSVEDSYNV